MAKEKKDKFESLLRDIEEIEILEEGRAGGRKWDNTGLKEFLTALIERAREKGKTKVYVPYDVIKEFYNGDNFPTGRKAVIRNKIINVLGLDNTKVHENAKAVIKLPNGKTMKGAITIDI